MAASVDFPKRVGARRVFTVAPNLSLPERISRPYRNFQLRENIEVVSSISDLSF
jgi:hypothetical protein